MVQAVDDESPPPRDLRDVIADLLGRDNETVADDADVGADAGERRFTVFPTVGGNPAVGAAVGALATLTDYWGSPATTTLTSILVSASFTTRKQVLIAARSDIYAPDDSWRLTGDWRYYDFTERTYGLGSDRPDSAFVDVRYDWYRLHQIVYRPVWGGFEVGVGYHLDVRQHIAPSENQQDPLFQEGLTGIESTTSSGVSFNLAYDRRDHPLSPDRGGYGRASYAFYRTGLGGDSDWESLQLEGRAYQKLPGARRQVLAIWGIG